MISVHEQNNIFSLANDELLQKCAALFAVLADQGEPCAISVNEDATLEGFDKGKIYFINKGVLAIYYQDTELFMLQSGDIFLPEFIPEIPSDDLKSDISYTTKFALHGQSFTAEELSKLLTSRPELIKLWIEITSLQQFLYQQTMAVLSPDEGSPTPKFESVKEGEIIIHEDDEADYVFTLMEGQATVLHKEVEVGNIGKDEIFGAIAVLLNQKRIATVKAETDCMLLKIHRDEFSKMVHSHPGLFLSLLENLASTIKNMNIKLTEAGILG